MIDEEVIKYLCQNNISLLKNKLKKNLISNDMLFYLNNRYVDSDSIYESLYRIKFNIEEKPKCKKCGKETKFSMSKNHVHFNIFCSRSCQIKSR